MADPLSIIGTAGAIANIIDVLTKTITTKWTESRSNEQSHQLVMQVDSCVTCCWLLIGKIDGEVSQFQKTIAGDLDLGSKLSFLFKTKDMEQIQRMVDQQTHTLTLLLSACNSNALEEQNRILQQPKIIQALQDMDRDTASLIVHRDSDSIVTATSVNSSRWSVQFAFDRELFITKVYEKWIRKLATTRRTNSHRPEDSTQQDHLQMSNNEIVFTSAHTDEEQNSFTHTQTAKSEPPSRPSSNFGERMNSLTRTALGIELQPLKRDRTTSDLRLQTKESRRIDQSLKDDSKLTQGEVKVAILGSKTRKRVFEEMRLSAGHPQCYTVSQLCIFRPIILGAVFESVQYLAKKLLVDEAIREDPLRASLEDVLLGDKEELDLDNGFEPWVVQIFRTIMDHPATKALLADETFVLPENVDYSFSEALIQYEATVNSHWLRNSSIIVIFNNLKGFAKRLAEAPLSDGFPDYAGRDDKIGAMNYILSRIKPLTQPDLQFYAHFTNGVYDDGDLLKIWRYIQDGIVDRALKSLLPR
uniref:GNA-3 g protein alpha subunit GNA-3 n=1 Tax=Fusarium oxysporum (strain Fo5176) TaxID=660025 RepID=A0A0D2XXT8_FUSOF